MKKVARIIHNLLFIDIDGVLTPTAEYELGKSPKISEEVWQRLKQLADQGFKISFITARTPYDLTRPRGFWSKLERHGLVDRVKVYCNFGLQLLTKKGAYIRTPKGGILLDITGMPVEKPPGFCSILKAEGNVAFHLLQKMYAGGEIKRYLDKMGTPSRKIDPEFLRQSIKLAFQPQDLSPEGKRKFGKNLREITNRLMKQYKERQKLGLPISVGVFEYKDVFFVAPLSSTKHIGVERALEEWGIERGGKLRRGTRYQAYAIGDSPWDKAMKIRPQIKLVTIKGYDRGFLKRTKSLHEEFNRRAFQRDTAAQRRRMPPASRRITKHIFKPKPRG